MKKIIIIFILLPIALCADFTNHNTGSRNLALGNAGSAITNNVYNIFVNPASGSFNKKHKLAISYQNLWGLSELANHSMAYCLPQSFGNFGFAYSYLGLEDEYLEQVFYFNYNQALPFYKKLGVGANIKLLNAEAKNYTGSKSTSSFDIDLGINYKATNYLNFAFSAKNLKKAEFKFLDVSEKIKTVYTFGALLNWRKDVNFAIDYNLNEDEKNTLHFGVEMWFFDTFAPRIGVDDDRFTAGFGIKSNYWDLNAAMLSHKQLGSTYRLSLGINIGKVVGKWRK